MKREVMHILQSAFLIMALSWLGLSLLFYLLQASYIFYPEKELLASPVDINLKYEEVSLKPTRLETIMGWYIPHSNPRASLIFFHGNGGNISHRLEKIRIFNELGLNIFIFDYRGYGASSGKPGEMATYMDGEAAYRYITEEKGIPADNLILYGESLGAAVASWTAQKHPHGALIIDSGFTSIPDIGRHYYPFLPVNIISRIRYPTLQHLEDIHGPLLIIHSTEDEIILFEFGLKLYNGANRLKTLLEIKGDHNAGFYLSENLYKNGINTFINQWF